MCDAFALLLEEEVNKQTRKFFGAKARWMMVAPRAAFVPSLQKAKDTFTIYAQSVVAKGEKNSRECLMDGTPQQFGWPRATWLLALGKFLNDRVGDRGLGWPDEERQKKVREWVGNNAF
jgi:hypothetical protein